MVHKTLAKIEEEKHSNYYRVYFLFKQKLTLLTPACRSSIHNVTNLSKSNCLVKFLTNEFKNLKFFSDNLLEYLCFKFDTFKKSCSLSEAMY